jgi:hypothetical protein
MGFLVDHLPEGKVEMISVLHGMAPDIDEFLALIEPKARRRGSGRDDRPGGRRPHGPRVIGIAFIQRPD